MTVEAVGGGGGGRGELDWHVAAGGGEAEVGALRVEALLLLPGNSLCYDCDEPCTEDPWVSLNHGTVICLHCAGRHRSLGVHISFVRSLKLDALKKTEWQALQRGGNDRFRFFLEEPAQSVHRHVWLELPMEARYHTPAADLYRRRLQAELAGSAELPTELRRVDLPTAASTSVAMRAAAMGAAVSEKSAVVAAPVWTADEVAARCELCRIRFSIFVRRHHCRRCGRCVCKECSPEGSWRPLPELGIDDPCRQCKVCVPPLARTIAGLPFPAAVAPAQAARGTPAPAAAAEADGEGVGWT